MKFKTNINCTGCLAIVTPALNAESKIEKWEVDLDSAERILTVHTSQLSANDVKKIVSKAGYLAEEIRL